MQRRTTRTVVLAFTAPLALLLVAGCTAATDTDPDGAPADAAVSYMDSATGECAADPLEGVDFETARNYIADF